MAFTRNSLKIYELFDKKKENQDHYALETLKRLYYPYRKTRDFHTINLFLSKFSICPYLILEGLSEDRTNGIIQLIHKGITKKIFPKEKFNSEIIKRIENPSKNRRFMKNLVSLIGSEQKDKRFFEPLNAERLFLLYGEKEHFELLIDKLKLQSELYNWDLEFHGLSKD